MSDQIVMAIFPPGVSGLEVAYGLGYLGQRVGQADDWGDLADGPYGLPGGYRTGLPPAGEDALPIRS